MGATHSTTTSTSHRQHVVRVHNPSSTQQYHQQPCFTRPQAEEKKEEGKFNDFKSYDSQSTSRHVGLENRAGENNCFLNATIQALWHLNLFREKVLYSDQSGGDENIDLIFSTESESIDTNTTNTSPDPGTSTDTLGALCSLFSQYQFTEDMCIPSTEIRFILSQLDDTGRFGIGDIADAAETLEAMLSHIHSSHVSKLCASPASEHGSSLSHNDFCHTGSTKCISHIIFGGVFVSQSSCRTCRATNEPAIIEPFFHYASVLALLSEASSARQGQGQRGRNMSFGHLLNAAFRNAAVECPSLDTTGRPLSVRSMRQVGGVGARGGVPQACTGRADVEMSCLESPVVLAVSLAWPSDSVPADLIQRFLGLMEGHVWLSEVFGTGNGSGSGSRSSGSNNTGGVNGNSSSSSSSGGGYQYAVPSAPPAQQTPPAVSSERAADKYLFRGFVCFYGKHYISIFQEWNPRTNNCEYLLFDDAHIRRLGQWENVKEECVRARYQPVLLLYEKQSSPQTQSHQSQQSQQVDSY